MARATQAIYNIAQIRTLEKLAMQQWSQRELIERAGLAAFHHLRQTWPQAKRIAIFCGIGNNAGDGYVLARHAKQQGLQPIVYQLDGVGKFKNVAEEAWQAYTEQGGEIKPWKKDETLNADVVVDALLGIGLKGPVTGIWEDVIAYLNYLNIPILAIDIPSGLDADTGKLWNSAIVASHTITFIGLKIGLMTGTGPHVVGKLFVASLDLERELFSNITPSAICLDHGSLPKRKRDAHKGNFGHVLIVGGNKGMPGSVTLAANAAARIGAGLISVATKPEHIVGVVAQCPEAMSHGIARVKQLLPLLARANVVVIGPGLGRDTWAKGLLRIVLKTNLPLIVDADALHFIQGIKRENWILTPHLGEARQLLNERVDVLQADRLATAARIQKQYGGVCILKGAGTIVAASEDTLGICPYGNPGMATGGMGDVLSGVIAGLVAQGMSLLEAAQLGVCIHAKAGDAAAVMGERGMIARDVVACLRFQVNEKLSYKM